VKTVSVVTPTWDRHGLLLDRCVPSVQAQDYPKVEHVIISDGPDEKLREVFRSHIPPDRRQDIRQGRRHPLWYYELPEHDPQARWGHWARLRGIELAAGEYITYCDDDDALRPEHCRLLAAALDANPDAGFAYARAVMHAQGGACCRIGTDPPAYGQISVMLMHRRELLDVATWRQGEPTIDWDLVSRWMDAGVGWVMADADTADIWPSEYR
jgi:glycosyltransferase involved in cell wall biosynthesis